MSSDPPASSNGEPAKGLPPVVPPSGRHIVQLFVVPGAIVLGVLVVVLGCTGSIGWFFGFSRTTKERVADLKSENPDVRWRAADDLAQTLKRDPQLANDPKLGLDLADLLAQALDDLDRETNPAALKTKRKYVQFLSSCLGNMQAPVGVPLLTRMAVKETSSDRKTAALLRRHAVWALANLGENLSKPDEGHGRYKHVVDRLSDEKNGTGQRADWARQTLRRLDGKEDYGVIPALAQCAAADDPDLRGLAALALGFWTGSPTENALAEQTLLRLSGPEEHGQGERVLLDKDD